MMCQITADKLIRLKDYYYQQLKMPDQIHADDQIWIHGYLQALEDIRELM